MEHTDTSFGTDQNRGDEPPTIEPGKPKSLMKKKILILSLLAVLIVGVVIIAMFSFFGKKPRTADEWLSLGDKYFLDMEYEQAIAAFLKVIKIDPVNIPARLRLAEIYLVTGQYDESEKWLQEILDIDAHNPDAYRLLQDLYDSTNDWDKLQNLLELMTKLGLERHIVFAHITGTVFELTADGVEEVMSGVQVTLTHTSHKNQEVKTNALGIYTFYVRPGALVLSFDKADYNSLDQALEAHAGQLLHLPALVLLPDSALPGMVSGQIIDSFTGQIIAGAFVRASSERGGLIEEVETDEKGYYVLELPIGHYLLKVEHDSYQREESRIFLFAEEHLVDQDFLLAPRLADGEVLISLTWEDSSLDLDAHLVGPLEYRSRIWQQPYQVNWFKPEGSRGLGPPASLSADIKDGSEAEIIRLLGGDENQYTYYAVDENTYEWVKRVWPGDKGYSYYVHNYSYAFNQTSPALAKSGAKVRILQNDGTVQEFSVPSGLTGDTWHVFDSREGVLQTPGIPDDKIPYLSDRPFDPNDDYADVFPPWEIGGFVKGSLLTMSRRLNDSEVDAMDVLGQRTIYEVVGEAGLPTLGFGETAEEYLQTVEALGIIAAYGSGDQFHNCWDDSRFPIAEFSPGDLKIQVVGYGDIFLLPVGSSTNSKPFPFDIKLGISLSDLAERLGFNSQTTALLQSGNSNEAKQFCRNNRITMLERMADWLPEYFFERNMEGAINSLVVGMEYGEIAFYEDVYTSYDYFEGTVETTVDRQLQIKLDGDKYSLILNFEGFGPKARLEHIAVAYLR